MTNCKLHSTLLFRLFLASLAVFSLSAKADMMGNPSTDAVPQIVLPSPGQPGISEMTSPDLNAKNRHSPKPTLSEETSTQYFKKNESSTTQQPGTRATMSPNDAGNPSNDN